MTTNIQEKLKTALKQLSFYTIISLSFVAGASIGYYYDFIKTNYSKQETAVSVKKSDVKIAIDENNNLLVIREKDGSYIVYQDSVGYMIFTLYAKNIWGQTAVKTNTN
jgi:hypothetical protein